MVGFITFLILAVFPSLRSKLNNPAPKKTQEINNKSSASISFESKGKVKTDVGFNTKHSEPVTKQSIISNALLEPIMARRSTISIEQTPKKIIENRNKDSQEQARVRTQSEHPSNTNTPAGLKTGGSKARTNIVSNTNSTSTVLSLPQNRTVGKIIDAGWISYGPLKVNMAKLIFLKGKGIVAPTVNENGRQLYLAFNCDNHLLNSTGPELEWGNWYSPNRDTEKQLISDVCKSPYAARLGLSSSSAY